MDTAKITQQLVQKGTDWGLKIAGVLLALFLAWIIAGWLRRIVLRKLEKRFDKMLAQFFANLLRYAILTAAVLGCLGVFGIQTASFAAVIAAMGLAIGLAFQGTLSNFAAGIMLLVFRPFKAGDYVEIGGKSGLVKELELFTTELVTLDTKRVIVPNSEVFGKVLVNYTHHPTRRVDIPVGTEYSADLDKTREVLEACAPEIEGVLKDPPPRVFLGELADNSVNWEVRVHCKTEDYWDVFQRTIAATKKALDAAEIGIPFPQRDVHLDAEALKALGTRR